MSKEKEPLNEKDVLKDMANKLVPKPVTFTVQTAYPEALTKAERKLQKKGKLDTLPQSRTFELKPLYLGTMLQMAPYLLDIELPDLSGPNLHEKVLKMITEHVADQCIIIALAINNDETRPPVELADYFRRNLTAAMLKDISFVIVSSMDLTSFLSSIILMKKGMSLLNPGEIARNPLQP